MGFNFPTRPSYAFSPTGRELLRRCAAPGTLLAFDFDGTLAPIVPTPGGARLPASTEALLRELGRRAPVAILSGRGLRDLRRRAPVPLRALLGNHGAEGLVLPAQRAKAVRLVRRWKRALQAGHGLPGGMRLEDKKLSLSLHYRACRNRAACKATILAAVASLAPLPRLVPGKCVVNLVPAGLPHKGTALQALLGRLGLARALYVGDDETDEDVFALGDPRIRSVRVGRKAGSRALLYLRRQSEIDRLLRLLLAAAP